MHAISNANIVFIFEQLVRGVHAYFGAKERWICICRTKYGKHQLIRFPCAALLFFYEYVIELVNITHDKQ